MGNLPYQLVQESFPSIIFAGILVYNMSIETKDFVDILARIFLLWGFFSPRSLYDCWAEGINPHDHKACGIDEGVR